MGAAAKPGLGQAAAQTGLSKKAGLDNKIPSFDPKAMGLTPIYGNPIDPNSSSQGQDANRLPTLQTGWATPGLPDLKYLNYDMNGNITAQGQNDPGAMKRFLTTGVLTLATAGTLGALGAFGSTAGAAGDAAMTSELGANAFGAYGTGGAGAAAGAGSGGAAAVNNPSAWSAGMPTGGSGGAVAESPSLASRISNYAKMAPSSSQQQQQQAPLNQDKVMFGPDGTPYIASSKKLKKNPRGLSDQLIKRGASGADQIDENGVQMAAIQALSKHISAMEKRLAEFKKKKSNRATQQGIHHG